MKWTVFEMNFDLIWTHDNKKDNFRQLLNSFWKVLNRTDFGVKEIVLYTWTLLSSLDVLWGQRIKLIQVASNSDLRKNQWNDFLFFEIVLSHCFGALEA